LCFKIHFSMTRDPHVLSDLWDGLNRLRKTGRELRHT
jgi:hypothetical protein